MLKFLTILIFLYTGNLFASCFNALNVKITYHDITTRSVGLSEEANYAKFTFLSSSDKAITIDKVLLKSKGGKTILENKTPAYINPFGKKEIIIGNLDTINIYAIENGAYECEFGSKLDKLLFEKQINFNKKISNFKYEDIKIKNKSISFEGSKYYVSKAMKNVISIRNVYDNKPPSETFSYYIRFNEDRISFKSINNNKFGKDILPEVCSSGCNYKTTIYKNGKSVTELYSEKNKVSYAKNFNTKFISYGLYSYEKKRYIVLQKLDDIGTNKFLKNDFNFDKSSSIIKIAVKADKIGKNEFLKARKLLNLAQGAKIQTTNKSQNDLKSKNKNNLKDNKALELFKKLRKLD